LSSMRYDAIHSADGDGAGSWELGAGAGALCGVTGKCSWETFRSAHISGMGRSRRSQEQPFDCHWEIIQFCGLHSN